MWAVLAYLDRRERPDTDVAIPPISEVQPPVTADDASLRPEPPGSFSPEDPMPNREAAGSPHPSALTPEERVAWISMLVRQGDRGTAWIEENWRDTDEPEVKLVLSEALARIGTQRSMNFLFDRLAAETNQGTRALLAGALDTVSTEAGLLVSVEMYLSARLPDVDTHVAGVIGRLGEAAMVENLAGRIHAGTDGNDARFNSAVAQVRQPAAVPALREAAMTTDSGAFREAAAFSLAKIGEVDALTGLVSIIESPASRSDPNQRERLVAILAMAKNTAAAREVLTTLSRNGIVSPDVSAALQEVASTPVSIAP